MQRCNWQERNNELTGFRFNSQHEKFVIRIIELIHKT